MAGHIHRNNRTDSKPGAEACAANRWLAIQEDGRFGTVLTELEKHGFNAGDKTRTDWLRRAMAYTHSTTLPNMAQYRDTNRRVWNAVNLVRAVSYWEVSFFAAAKKYFPRVRGSNLGYTKWTSEYCIPDGDSFMPCLDLPKLSGAVPGGDQNGVSTYQHYNDFDLLGTAAEGGYRGVLAKYHNISNYTKTAFSVMQVSTIQVRGMVLGGMQSTPPVPVQPWIAFPNYQQATLPPGWFVRGGGWPGRAPLYRDNPFWQEQLLHMAASGVPSFLYFAPWNFGVTMAELATVVKSWPRAPVYFL